MRSVSAAIRRPLLGGLRARRVPSPGPRLRRRLIAVAVAAALLAALYMLWLRDSSLVAIERVEVTGLTTEDAGRLRAALTSTAETMTTLNLDRARLEDVASAFPVVAGLELTPDFPDGLVVHVIEHRPVARVDFDGELLPVAADGSLLTGVTVEGEVPTLPFEGSPPEGVLPPGATRDAARVAAAAPAVIARRVETIALDGEDEARGLVAELENGVEIVFGDPTRAAAKWAAAVRVLADEGAAEAVYVDVRVPQRPAAGGVASTDPYAVAPTQYDPATGFPIDPATGLPYDPETGLTIDPATGLATDPATGLTIDPATGQTVDLATGQAIDPATGLPLDPATGLPVDPATGLPFDPSTGAAVNP